MNDLDRAKEAIFKEIETSHNTLLNALADIAADEGDEWTEKAIRWIARTRRHPVYTIKDGEVSYLWHADRFAKAITVWSIEIPSEISGLFKKGRYETLSEAYADLIQALARYMKDNEPQWWHDL